MGRNTQRLPPVGSKTSTKECIYGILKLNRPNRDRKSMNTKSKRKFDRWTVTGFLAISKYSCSRISRSVGFNDHINCIHFE